MFAEQEVLIRQESSSDFTILKSDNLVIGGYASIEIVDKQNDLITLEALEKPLKISWVRSLTGTSCQIIPMFR